MTAEREAMDRQALEDQRRFLLRSLADLDAERAAGDLGEEDYVELRDHYTAKAAAVLRRLESDDPGAGPEGDRPGARSVGSDDPRGRRDVVDEDGGGPTPGRRRPMAEEGRPGEGRAGGTRRPWRAVAIVAGVLAFGALLGWAVARATSPSLPGETITGSQANEEADELIQAEKLVTDGNPVGALKLYNKVLAADPSQPEALTSKGWILAQAGLTSEALNDFAQAEAADPAYSDVHVYRGIVLLEGKDDPSGALAEFRYYLRHHPDPQLLSMVRKAMARAERALAKTKSN